MTTYVDWEHLKQICERMTKDGSKSARELYTTLIFAVETTHAVDCYVKTGGKA